MAESYIIKESLNPDNVCEDLYKFNGNNDTGLVDETINLSRNMVLLYRLIDGKHDFSGGTKGARSYISENDCNNTIVKTQLDGITNIPVERVSLYQMHNTHNNINKILYALTITKSANTLHPIFSFTSEMLNKVAYNENDNLEIGIIDANNFEQEMSNINRIKYCVKRPYYKVYSLFNRDNKTINTKVIEQLKLDVKEYGAHGIFTLKVNKKENLKKNVSGIRDKIADIFEISSESNYTIDQTHLSKDSILKPLFHGKESDSIFGDYLDPSSVLNGDKYRIDTISKQEKGYVNRFHYCFFKGKSVELQLENIEQKGKMKFTFIYEGRQTDFTYPETKLQVADLAPSVADISLFIQDKILLKKGVKKGCIFGLLGATSKLLAGTKKLPKSEKARMSYFAGFFSKIVNAIEVVVYNNAPKLKLTDNEMITAITSLKTIGDQVRLSDSQMIKQITNKESYCATLDTFLFDFGVASRKTLLLGDTGSVNDFHIHVYINRDAAQEEAAVIDKIKQNNNKINNLYEIDEIDETINSEEKFLYIKNKLINGLNNPNITFPINSETDINNNLTKDYIELQEEMLNYINVYVIDKKKLVIRNKLMEKFSDSNNLLENLIRQIESKINDYSNLIESNRELITEENNKYRRYNILDFKPNNLDQKSIINHIQKLHLQYYILNLINTVKKEKDITKIELAILIKLETVYDNYVDINEIATIEKDNILSIITKSIITNKKIRQVKEGYSMKDMFDIIYDIIKHPNYLQKHTIRYHLLELETLYFKNTSTLIIAPIDITLPNFGETDTMSGGNPNLADAIILAFIDIIFNYTTMLRSGKRYIRHSLSFYIDLENILYLCRLFVRDNGYEELNKILLFIWNDSENDDIMNLNYFNISNSYNGKPISRYIYDYDVKKVVKKTVPISEQRMEVEEPEEQEEPEENLKRRRMGGDNNKLDEETLLLKNWVILKNDFYHGLINNFNIPNYDLINTTFTVDINNDSTIVQPIGINKITGQEQYPGVLWSSLNPGKNIPSGYIENTFIDYFGDSHVYLQQDTKEKGIREMSDIKSNTPLEEGTSLETVSSTTSSAQSSKGGKKQTLKKKRSRNIRRKYKTNNRTRKGKK